MTKTKIQDTQFVTIVIGKEMMINYWKQLSVRR